MQSFARFAVVLAFLMLALPARSYLLNYTGGNNRDHWASLPVGWNLNPKINSNVQGSRSVADVMASSFAAWTAVPNTAFSVARGSDSARTSPGMDSQNLICFVCAADFSGMDGSLAITLTTTATSVGADDGRGGKTQFVGQILDADILFNPSVAFSTDGSAAGQDLQTVATHEIGHLFGLDHSAVVHAMMFPYAPDNEHRLAYDDAAAIATLYPAAQAVPPFAIAGTVRLNGAAVFGAHVFAESQTAVEAFSAFNLRKSPIAGMSMTDGSYRIEGVPADSYVITAEPLDLPVDNSNIASFASNFGKAAVQTNFTTRWH